MSFNDSPEVPLAARDAEKEDSCGRKAVELVGSVCGITIPRPVRRGPSGKAINLSRGRWNWFSRATMPDGFDGSGSSDKR